MFRTPFFKNTSEWLLLEFYDSSEDNIDPGDKDGNQEDNLEKLSDSLRMGEAGIYPSNFTNVRFGTKTEFLNVLFHEKWLATKLLWNASGFLEVLQAPKQVNGRALMGFRG